MSLARSRGDDKLKQKLQYLRFSKNFIDRIYDSSDYLEVMTSLIDNCNRLIKFLNTESVRKIAARSKSPQDIAALLSLAQNHELFVLGLNINDVTGIISMAGVDTMLLISNHQSILSKLQLTYPQIVNIACRITGYENINAVIHTHDIFELLGYSAEQITQLVGYEQGYKSLDLFFNNILVLLNKKVMDETALYQSLQDQISVLTHDVEGVSSENNEESKCLPSISVGWDNSDTRYPHPDMLFSPSKRYKSSPYWKEIVGDIDSDSEESQLLSDSKVMSNSDNSADQHQERSTPTLRN